MTPAEPGHAAPTPPIARRWLPFGILLVLIVLFFAFGGHRLLSFDALALRYGESLAWRNDNPILAVLATIAIYAGATAISVPAGWLLTVSVGILFGWAAGAAIVVVAATIGATILFLAARSALAPFFRKRAGNLLNRFADGFRTDAASYLLFLRLVPVIPFAMLNIVPAILGVPLRTFVWTTLVGIIPGTIAYAVAGEGLRSIVAERAEACAMDVPPCGTTISAGDLVTPQILIAFVVLALVALLPVVLKRWRGHKDQTPS